MVYESDFYTTRRPYSSYSRPTVTSYSVTPEPLLLGKSHVFHHHLPYVAHKRLVPYTHMPAPAPHNSVRASVIANELDRIQHRSRPHFSHVPTEDYLNSRAVVNFDDDVRSIRAHTATLLKRVQSPIPRAPRMPLSSAFDHIETAIPDRITSDAYISTLLSPRNNVDRVVQKMCQYPDIHDKAYHNIGKGHLACVTFSGGKAYPRRKHVMVSGHGADEGRNVRADINFLSYYKEARNGANEVATHEVPLYTKYRRSPEPHTPRSYYRLIRPYNKPTKSAPATVQTEKAEEVNGHREEEEYKERQNDAARQLAEDLLRREQEEEAERIAAELEKEAAEREEQARLARAARLAEQKAEEERLAAEKEEEERLLAELAEQERIAAERAAEEERLAEENAERERAAVAKAEEERLAAEEEERERLEAERLEEERLEAERIEAEREAEEERIRAAQAEEERYANDQGKMDEQRLAAELTENLLRIKAEKEKEEQEEEEESSERERELTEEPESKKEDEYVSDEDNDKAVAESSEEDDEAKDELVDEGHPLVEYPVTPDVTGNENKSLTAAAEEVTSTEEEEEEE